MRRQFVSPVWIHERGLDFRSVCSAEEAYAFLKGWRGPRAAIYDHTIATLGAAMNGDVGVERARDVFRQFAASEHILAEADVA